MPRLFVGNFDFEHRLANAGYQPSKSLIRLCAERASAWLAVAEDGDYLWSPLPVDSSFATEVSRLGLPRVIAITDFSQVPAGVELIPWGWTADLVELAQRRHWDFAAPDAVVVRQVNSRCFSWTLESEGQVGLRGSSLVRDVADLTHALQAARAESDRIVIKAEFGMSGRERILVTGNITDAQRAWIVKRLADSGAVVVEPWVDCIEEAGVQIEIPHKGPPALVGLTSLISDDQGQYRGNWFTDPFNAGPNDQERWQSAVEIAMQAAQRIQSAGYFGPLGIDAMRYRAADGAVQIRPLMDINARWTMGRLSLGWRRFLQPDERGFWSHAPNRRGLSVSREFPVPSTLSPNEASNVLFIAAASENHED